jgi:glycosyltransferase involved in cell wall biosynthesis
MIEYPLVTIVTPSYNQGRFIEATITSVLNQGYPNLEYLVIDGGSTDNTLDILKQYDGKLKWISEKDKGQSDAINKGFKLARGEIVAWLNSDDTYEPGAIQAAVDYFNKHDNVALVYGEGDIIDEFGLKVKRFDATQDFDLWTLIHVWDYIMQPATFFRRDALKQVNYLDENLHWCMDWDLWIKLALRYDVGFINQVFANSREYAETKTSTGGWKRFREIISLMRKYGNKKYPPGWFLYGASTLYANNSNNKLSKFISSAVMFVVHNHVHKNLPIKYKDNWIGHKYNFTIPAGKKKVIIRGDAVFGNNLPLNITVDVNGVILANNKIISTGYFEVMLYLDQIESVKYGVLKVDRLIVPASFSDSSDHRKLSVKIDELLFV